MKNKRLIIVGAGGFGRECLVWARAIPESERDWEVVGFIDNNLEALRNFNCEVGILGTIDDYVPQPNEVLLLAIGTVGIKLKLAKILAERGASFLTLIHPSAIIGDRIRLGTGCVICPNVVISTDVTIGNFVSLNIACTIGHDVVIGDGATLSSHVDLTGGVSLQKGVFVGSRASILPKVKVGEFAVVGAASVVTKTVKNDTTVFGVPAKEI